MFFALFRTRPRRLRRIFRPGGSNDSGKPTGGDYVPPILFFGFIGLGAISMYGHAIVHFIAHLF